MSPGDTDDIYMRSGWNWVFIFSPRSTENIHNRQSSISARIGCPSCTSLGLAAVTAIL
jgi:hypothetical protein